MKSPKNGALVLLLLLLLGGGLVAWRQYQELVKLRAEVGSGSTRADLQRRVTDLGNRLKAAQAQLAAAPAPNASDKTGSVAAGGNAAGARRVSSLNLASVMNGPQMQKLAAIQMKGSLDNRYAGLFRSLHLAPEQLDQLKDALVQKQQAQQDATMAAMQQGINPANDPQGFQEALAAAQAPINDQIKAQLGEAAFAQYQQYQEQLPQHVVVNQVQQTLSYSSQPLSDDQAAQLTQLLAQNAPANPNSMANALGVALPITNEAMAAAQSLLSPPQFQALQEVQQQQQAQQQMQKLIQEAARTAGVGAGASAGAAAGGGVISIRTGGGN